MTLSLVDVLRNNRLDEITTDQDAGAGASLLRIYDGGRPADADSALATVSPLPVLLAELTFSDPSYPAASGGVLTASAITDDSSANATGTATWFRVVDSDSNAVMDGYVGTSGSSPDPDLVLNTVSIVALATVSVTSYVLTEGNA